MKTSRRLQYYPPNTQQLVLYTPWHKLPKRLK
jgi:hypothetical protein